MRVRHCRLSLASAGHPSEIRRLLQVRMCVITQASAVERRTGPGRYHWASRDVRLAAERRQMGAFVRDAAGQTRALYGADHLPVPDAPAGQVSLSYCASLTCSIQVTGLPSTASAMAMQTFNRGQQGSGLVVGGGLVLWSACILGADGADRPTCTQWRSQWSRGTGCDRCDDSHRKDASPRNRGGILAAAIVGNVQHAPNSALKVEAAMTSSASRNVSMASAGLRRPVHAVHTSSLEKGGWGVVDVEPPHS